MGTDRAERAVAGPADLVKAALPSRVPVPTIPTSTKLVLVSGALRPLEHAGNRQDRPAAPNRSPSRLLKVTRQTDYAVLLLTQFAVANRALSARELALRTGLSVAMVSKVLKLLLEADLLTSQVGAKGGYALAKDPSEINMADVVGALDGPVAVTACSDGAGQACEHEHWCPCRPHWRHINDAIRSALEAVSLAAIAGPLISRRAEKGIVGQSV